MTRILRNPGPARWKYQHFRHAHVKAWWVGPIYVFHVAKDW